MEPPRRQDAKGPERAGFLALLLGALAPWRFNLSFLDQQSARAVSAKANVAGVLAQGRQLATPFSAETEPCGPFAVALRDIAHVARALLESALLSIRA
jgi:hypothetical protein